MDSCMYWVAAAAKDFVVFVVCGRLSQHGRQARCYRHTGHGRPFGCGYSLLIDGSEVPQQLQRLFLTIGIRRVRPGAGTAQGIPPYRQGQEQPGEVGLPDFRRIELIKTLVALPKSYHCSRAQSAGPSGPLGGRGGTDAYCLQSGETRVRVPNAAATQARVYHTVDSLNSQTCFGYIGGNYYLASARLGRSNGPGLLPGGQASVEGMHLYPLGELRGFQGFGRPPNLRFSR